ncbi:MAG: zf-HC2 domain-containing protein [Candidatus Eremiobacteraeota bacterium]|nr:zf-HC2 domain-containing protein [Candidatus Eremiobacteraeota bacterium]
MSAHLGDELELYALGDLSAEERAAVEQHLESCDTCVRALGEAEEALAQMTSLLPAYRAPKRTQLRNFWAIPAARMAIAASFVVGLLVAAGTLPFLNARPTANSDDVRAQVAMTHAHFVHTELRALAPNAPAVKVIYARDRAWAYVIADNGLTGYHLLETAPGGSPADLGTLVAHGESASLFIDHPLPSGELDLVRNGQTLARGMLP